MKVTLRALRANYGLTQSQAASLVGITKTMWYDYEKCRTYPNVKVIQRIEKEFNVTYNDLVFKPKLRLNSNNN